MGNLAPGTGRSVWNQFQSRSKPERPTARKTSSTMQNIRRCNQPPSISQVATDASLTAHRVSLTSYSSHAGAPSGGKPYPVHSPVLLAQTQRNLETLRDFVEATMQTYSHGQAQVKHLRLRTCHWTQRLKTLPTARTRQPPHKTVKGMATRITWDFAPVTGRKVSNHCQQRARGSRHTKHS